MLRAAALAGLLSLAACGSGTGDSIEDFFGGPDTPAGESMTTGERALALEVFALVNERRRAEDLPPLLWSEEAADVAYDHAVDMRLRSFYDHTNPDGVGPCERLVARQIAMTACGGENIARNNPTPQDVMAAWMASPSHSTRILSPGVTHIGVGVHTGRDGPWWVQDYFRLVDDS